MDDRDVYEALETALGLRDPFERCPHCHYSSDGMVSLRAWPCRRHWRSAYYDSFLFPTTLIILATIIVTLMITLHR